MATKQSKGWTPVRNRDVYCSPACGGGCTLAAFERATERAEALATRLGDGWKPRVWENLGWYYSATKGKSVMHENRYNGNGKVTDFTLFINASPQIVTSGATPDICIAKARARFTEIDLEIKLLHSQLRQIETIHAGAE